MKNLIVLAIILLASLSACTGNKSEDQSSTTTESNATVVNLSPKEFSEKSSKGIILDVRTPQEVSQGKIPNSQAIDFYHADFLAKAKELPKDQDIYLYCAVGARSEEAAHLLLQEGYTHVYHLQGGIQAWYQNGFPIE